VVTALQPFRRAAQSDVVGAQRTCDVQHERQRQNDLRKGHERQQSAERPEQSAQHRRQSAPYRGADRARLRRAALACESMKVGARPTTSSGAGAIIWPPQALLRVDEQARAEDELTNARTDSEIESRQRRWRCRPDYAELAEQRSG